MERRWRQLVGGLVLGGLLACGDTGQRTDGVYGLDRIALLASAEALGRLRSRSKQDHATGVTVVTADRSLRATASYTGKSSEHQYKRNYHLYFPYERFHGRRHLRLSSQGSDPSHLRAEVGFKVFALMGLPVPDMAPIVLAINDDDQGLYHTLEPITEEFFHQRYLAVNQAFKARFGRLNFADFSPESLDDLKTGYSVAIGAKDYSRLRAAVVALHQADFLADQSGFEGHFAVDRFLRYMAAAVYLNHWDGFGNNYYLYGTADDQRLHIMPWDLDKVWQPGLAWQAGVSLWGQGTLAQRLLLVPAYKAQYLGHLRYLVQEALPVAALQDLLATKHKAIGEALAADAVAIAQFGGGSEAYEELVAVSSAWVAALAAELASQDL